MFDNDNDNYYVDNDISDDGGNSDDVKAYFMVRLGFCAWQF